MVLKKLGELKGCDTCLCLEIWTLNYRSNVMNRGQYRQRLDGLGIGDLGRLSVSIARLTA